MVNHMHTVWRKLPEQVYENEPRAAVYVYLHLVARTKLMSLGSQKVKAQGTDAQQNQGLGEVGGLSEDQAGMHVS